MKIIFPIVLCLQLGTAHASLIGIMDSGTDISHKDLAPRTWFNPNEKAGNIDLDLDGLPGDVNGWDFTNGTASPFDPQYNYLITQDVKTFFQLYSKYESKTIAANEVAWLQAHAKDESLMSKVDFVGGYIHGTHVAGISTNNLPTAKIFCMKVLPTVYVEPVAAKPALVSPPNGAIQAISVEQLTQNFHDTIAPQVEQMVGLNSIMNFHHVDVVNQSFGIGYKDALNAIHQSFLEDVRREPTKEELNSITNLYMTQLVSAGEKMFQAAPDTIFAIAAGNDTSNNDVLLDYPAGIKADNKIVVAATWGYQSLAEFSNYGANKVDVAAPGVAITSTAPTDTYIALSGTSQAAPFVTNTVALIKDMNPKLNARDTKAIVLETVDVKPWLQGKVKTAGIVNKLRAKKAAIYSRSMSLSLAISKARVDVSDVPTPSSFNKMYFEKLDLGYKPRRPALNIKILK